MKGLRTFIGVMVGIVALVVGLTLVDVTQRRDVFFAFAGAVVGALGVLGAKSVGSSAVAGDGLSGGVRNLMTPAKPPGGDKPAA